jgi:hypothetical protein
MLVGKRMTRGPKTVGPEDLLTRAADLVRKFRINHLPVVEEGKLVGILSDTDLRNASLTSNHLSGLGELQVPDRKVREVMKAEVWSLAPEDSVEDGRPPHYPAEEVRGAPRAFGRPAGGDHHQARPDQHLHRRSGYRRGGSPGRSGPAPYPREVRGASEYGPGARRGDAQLSHQPGNERGGQDGGPPPARHGQRADGPGNAPGGEVRGPGPRLDSF